MGIFDIFRSRGGVPVEQRREPRVMASAEVSSIADLDDPRIQEYLRGRGFGSEAGAPVNPHSALKVATAFRCAAIINGAIATLPMDIKRRTGNTRVDANDAIIWDVLKTKPNPWQTPSEFKRLMQMMVLMRGNGHALIVRGAFGKIKWLIPLVGAMQVKQNTDFTLTYTYNRPDGAQITIAQEDILHLRGMSLDGINGLSVLGFARETIGISIQSEKHLAKVFKNGTSVGTVLSTAGEVDDRERLKADLEEYRGAENAHKTLILEGGLKWEKVDLSNLDLQFIQNREITATEICMFFGVPPFMVGLTTKQTSWGSGVEQMGIGFVAYTLQDWFTMWQDAIKRDLQPPDDPTLYVRINPSGLLRADIKTRVLSYAVGRQWGWWSADDVREMEDENPLPDGIGQTYLQAVNMQDASKATADLAAHDPNAPTSK
ncbi:HK97 family phage portal protein [Bradyrhizobium sp. USDA 4011]